MQMVGPALRQLSCLILKHLVADGHRQIIHARLEGRVVLDPMMGGGTTLHEALRLGASVVGGDIDPIPVLQARATLSAASLPALEKGFAALMAALQERLGRLFTTHCPTCGAEEPLRFVLYGAQRRCACGPALLVDSTTLRHENGGLGVQICPRCHAIAHGPGDHVCGCTANGRPPLVEKSPHCAACGEPCGGQRPVLQRYTPLAVVSHCATARPVLRRPPPRPGPALPPPTAAAQRGRAGRRLPSARPQIARPVEPGRAQLPDSASRSSFT